MIITFLIYMISKLKLEHLKVFSYNDNNILVVFNMAILVKNILSSYITHDD